MGHQLVTREEQLQLGEISERGTESGFEESMREFRQNTRLRASEARILGAMLEFPCPKRLSEELANPSWKEIDRFYSERHDFIRRVIIDHLRNRLGSFGPSVSVKAECGSRTGRVGISVGTAAVTETRVPFRIRIEIKGDKSFEIAQAVRYLLDSDAIVVCLAGSGKAFTVKKEDAHGFLIFLSGVLAFKMRILEGDSETKIPGPWCKGCPVACSHAVKDFSYDVDFQRDLIEPLGNWNKAIDAAVNQVVELLNSSRELRT